MEGVRRFGPSVWCVDVSSFFFGAALFWGFVSDLEERGGCVSGRKCGLCVRLFDGGGFVHDDRGWGG